MPFTQILLLGISSAAQHSLGSGNSLSAWELQGILAFACRGHRGQRGPWSLPREGVGMLGWPGRAPHPRASQQNPTASSCIPAHPTVSQPSPHPSVLLSFPTSTNSQRGLDSRGRRAVVFVPAAALARELCVPGQGGARAPFVPLNASPTSFAYKELCLGSCNSRERFLWAGGAGLGDSCAVSPAQ